MANRSQLGYDNYVWGWQTYPQATSEYLADDVGRAWSSIVGSDSRGLGFPAISLLALSELDDEESTVEFLDAYRASVRDRPPWSEPGAFERFLFNEIGEEEISTYSPFPAWSPWSGPSKPGWALRTSLDLGAYFLATGDPAKAAGYLQRAVDTDLRHEVEWLLARHALDKLE
jgi:hypothetical protein